MNWYLFTMFLLPAVIMLTGVLFNSYDPYPYVPPIEVKPTNGQLSLQKTINEAPLSIIFFEPREHRNSNQRDALIKELLAQNFTASIIVTPCDNYFAYNHVCSRQHSVGEIYIYKRGRRLNSEHSATHSYVNRSIEQLILYINKITRNYDVFISRDALELEFTKQRQKNVTTVVQFSTTCSKWTHGLFVNTIQNDFTSDSVRVALVKNEALIQEYTNDTKDAFMIVSQYDKEPLVSRDYLNLRVLINRYSWPLFSQLHKENRDDTVALVSVEREGLDEISRVMVPVAKRFRGRMAFAYNATDTPGQSLQIQVEKTGMLYSAYWYNGDLQNGQEIGEWIDSVLNRTAIKSQLIPRVNDKYVKTLVGVTVDDFINQDKDVVLLVRNQHKEDLAHTLRKFENVAQEQAGKVSFGIIDWNKNDISSLKHIKSTRSLMLLYIPVGSKREILWIDAYATESDLVRLIEQRGKAI